MPRALRRAKCKGKGADWGSPAAGCPVAKQTTNVHAWLPGLHVTCDTSHFVPPGGLGSRPQRSLRPSPRLRLAAFVFVRRARCLPAHILQTSVRINFSLCRVASAFLVVLFSSFSCGALRLRAPWLGRVSTIFFALSLLHYCTSSSLPKCHARRHTHVLQLSIENVLVVVAGDTCHA